MAIFIAVVGYFSVSAFWFWICWVFVGAGLVAIGCIGEWVLFINPAPESNEKLKSHHRHRELQFITAVAIGVTMDFIGLFHEIPEAVRLESNNLVLQTNVSSLNGAVIQLAHQYDLSTNALAEANARLAEAKSEAIELQKLKQPRTISPESIARFVNVLKNDPDKYPVWVIFSSGSDETAKFAKRLRTMLDDAGFAVSKKYTRYENPSTDPPLNFLFGSGFTVGDGLIILPDSSQQNPHHPSAGSAPAPQIDPRPTTARSSNTDEENPFKQLQLHVVEWKETYEFFGFLAGIAVLIVLICQYGEMVTATKVAVGQLNAMQGQLDEMKRAPQLDERAWVAPYDSATEFPTDNTNIVVFKMMIKNTGKTPAVNGIEWHGHAYDSKAITNGLIDVQTNSFMLAPDTTAFIGVKIDKGWTVSIKYGQPFFVYGKISYDDIFRNHHWTEFCWTVDSDLNFKPAPFNNTCDEAQTNQAN